MYRFKCSLFIFRRDLRLYDNRSLIQAFELSERVVPIFIFDPDQLKDNPYRSERSVQFMVESLQDLSEQLHAAGGQLYLFHDHPEKVVKKLYREVGIEAVFLTRDYTPYSKQRDQKIEKACQEKKISFYALDDLLLHAPEETLKANGQPYTLFTPYYHHAETLAVTKPEKLTEKRYYTKPIKIALSRAIYQKIVKQPVHDPFLRGGRREALKRLEKLSLYQRYEKERDFPAIEEGTTQLSAYLKFTVISPRELYHAIEKSLSKHHPLIRSLYWRDFFTHIAYFFPHLFQGPFVKKYSALKWKKSPTLFKKWCEGKTGFPIVDAGMRALNQTGFMHNRVRMIVASFLVKDLNIDWRLGERYFAQQLIDYDPSVNNGNWQWVASTGCDAQPYFRIFNPWLQQKKFDPQCAYIKKWVPELRELSAKTIHALYKEAPVDGYPAPLVDHTLAARAAIARYKKARLRPSRLHL